MSALRAVNKTLATSQRAAAGTNRTTLSRSSKVQEHRCGCLRGPGEAAAENPRLPSVRSRLSAQAWLRGQSRGQRRPASDERLGQKLTLGPVVEEEKKPWISPRNRV